MRPLIVFAGILGAAISAPTWAINKCTDQLGRVAFQEAPCAGKGEVIKVRPASGHDIPAAPVSTGTFDTPAAPLTETERNEAQIAASQRERRRREIDVRFLPDTKREIALLRKQCDQELRTLQDKKILANNNLAGATWEASISTEMSAVATRCDTRNRELSNSLESLRKECQALGGCN